MVSFDIAAKRQLAGMQAAGQRLVEGYQSQTEHPGEKAARNQQGYLQGVQRSVNKWAKNVATKHTLDDLKQRMASKGSAAYTASAATANAAYRRNAQQWYQIVASIKADIDATMPRGDAARNLQRATTFIQRMQAASAQMQASGV